MTSLKANFAVQSKFEAFYIGGKVQLSTDGAYMFCCCGNKLNILEISMGKIYAALGEKEDEEITSFSLTPDNKYVILATQPLLLRQWDWKEQKLIRTWKAIHTAPVVTTGFDSTSTLLATGSTDATIKVWDIDKKYCTHNLRGHQVFISCVAFHPDIERLELYSAGGDYKVRIWNLKTSTCIAEIGAHFSAVTSIVFSSNGNNAYTSGRDGVVVMLDTHEHKVAKTIPVFEKVESVILLPEGEDFVELNVDGNHPHFITAGSKGLLRVWNTKTSRCVYTTSEIQCSREDPKSESGTDTDDVQHISQMMYNATLNMVIVVTYDHNISMFNLADLKLNTQFAGNNDEIIDLKYFGENDEYAMVATNSKNVKMFKLTNWSCEIVYGHTDTVLSLDVVKKGNRMISAGKDTSVRLWEITQEGLKCLAVGQGHTNPVAAVAFSRLKCNYFVSGSEDCTLKVWPIPKDLDPSSVTDIHPSLTERAHEKEINSVTVSPNDKFIATGSMDKTAKMWNAKDLSLVGVMRGHKRGIWCVQFSPVDQILATCSSDALVKLWSLTDFTCVKTFEGHESSVMKVAFITNGMQLLSGDSEGLVRLWTIKTNECEKILEGHEGKIWALSTNRAEDSFISGGVDSSVVLWEDVTEKEELEKRDQQQQVILQEQELSNLIQKKKYLKAIGLAIVLEQPFRVLNIVKEILSEYENGEEKLLETLQKMRLDQIDALLHFSNKWNTNSRHCHEAQFILSTVLKIYPATELKKMGNIRSSIEGLLPYTERHFNRMDRLLQQSMFLEYTWQSMKGLGSDSQTSMEMADGVSDTEEDTAIAADREADLNNLNNTADTDDSSSEEEMMEIPDTNVVDNSDSSSESDSEDMVQVRKAANKQKLVKTTNKQKTGNVKDKKKSTEIKNKQKAEPSVIKTTLENRADSESSSSEEEILEAPVMNVGEDSDSSSESDTENIVQSVKGANKQKSKNEVVKSGPGQGKNRNVLTKTDKKGQTNVKRTNVNMTKDSDSSEADSVNDLAANVNTGDDSDASSDDDDNGGNTHVMKRIKHAVNKATNKPRQQPQVQKGPTKRKISNSDNSSFTKMKKKKGGTSPTHTKKQQETSLDTKKGGVKEMDRQLKETKRTKVKNGAKMRKTSRNR